MSSSFLQQAEEAHQAGDLAAAAAIYARALESGENAASALYGLGTVALQQQRFPEAVEYLRDAAAHEPEAADILLSLAQGYFRLGDRVRATDVALRCAPACRHRTGMSNALARLLLNLEQPAAAANQLQSLKEPNATSQRLLARAFAMMSLWGQAMSLLRQLVARQPDNAQLNLELSQAAARLRDFSLAIRAFSAHLQQLEADNAPGDSLAEKYLRFADLLLMARDVPAARERIEQAGRYGADSAQFHLLRARVLYLAGEEAQANSACDAALERDSSLGEAWQLRVETGQKSELPGMIVRMRDALSQDSGDAYQRELLAYALGDAHRKLDQINQAANDYRQANALQYQQLAATNQAYDARWERARCDALISQFAECDPAPSIASGLPRPIFVVGMPRSGTTLVEKMLGQIDGVATLGENEALGIVEAELQHEQAAGRLPDVRDISPQQWSALADRYLELSPCSSTLLVDKMPHNFLRVGMILRMFPDARVLQMRRDPRDVCLSIYTRPFAPVHNYACDAQALPDACANATSLMDHWSALDPARVLNVSFEDLVRDPVAHSKRLTEFCGLSWSERCLDFHESISPSFTFSERQVRSEITDRGVGQWQAFADSLPELFNSIAIDSK